MWDSRYSDTDFAYGKEANDFLAEQASHVLPSVSQVLCLAEGEGRNAVALAKLGHNVMAVDLSEPGLKKAKALASENNVTIETSVADLATYDLGNSQWDAIVSIFCHLPPPIRRNVHKKVIKALKPGGILILEAYTPKQLEFGTGGPPNAAMMMSMQDLREELKGLDFEIGRELERNVVEGKYHTGRGHVVQVVARNKGNI
mmetsp:Transcript_28033/g.39485  ORF Transcript_28033/g.39485 Transcript_28033/m.39485 type:complete len:201 (+) Transcript_28033:109-711(+)